MRWRNVAVHGHLHGHSPVRIGRFRPPATSQHEYDMANVLSPGPLVKVSDLLPQNSCPLPRRGFRLAQGVLANPGQPWQLLRIKHDGGVCVHRAGRGKPPFYSPHHRLCDPRNSVWLRRTPHWRRGRSSPAPNHSWVEV